MRKEIDITENTVLITGANGFIARNLAKTLKGKQLRVIGTSRRPVRIDGFDKIHEASLMESLANVFETEKIDTVIHCANHVGENEFEINVNGTTRWLKEAKENGVDNHIFLSSISAKPNVPSEYGRAKYELEQIFISEDGVIFRLGLVIGNGGMFGKIKQSMQKSPLVPIIDNGSRYVHVLGIDFLCHVIVQSILTSGEGLRGKLWHIHQPKPYTLRDVMVEIRKQFGYSCRFVPVPSLPILWAVSAVEKLRFLKLPVSSTNLKGLRQTRNETTPSDFVMFGQPEQSLEELVSKAARPSG